MADVGQMKKIVPFVTCEITFGEQPNATLLVLDTCLIVGLLPLIIILITASMSSNMWSLAPNRRRLRVRRNTITITQLKIVVLGWIFSLVLGVLV